MTSNYTITVLGLGAMGLPMATRLASELTVHGFDIAEPRLKLAEEAGMVGCVEHDFGDGAEGVAFRVQGQQLAPGICLGEPAGMAFLFGFVEGQPVIVVMAVEGALALLRREIRQPV